MLLQLSSGQGPCECELAVGKFLRWLQNNFDIEVIQSVRGKYPDTYKSALLSCGEELRTLDGSVKWICQSPYRPNHKRKNWFIDVSVVGEAEQLELEDKLIRFETFRSSGKGGQHVNKVETGVRAVYIPTGLSVVSTAARSQHMNKRIALDKLCEIIANENSEKQLQQEHYNFLERKRLERGNAKLVFQGMDFVEIG